MPVAMSAAKVASGATKAPKSASTPSATARAVAAAVASEPAPTKASTPSSAPAAAPAPAKRSANPAVDAVLAKLKKQVKASQAAVADADHAVTLREDEYITATWTHGNLMRGWDSYVRKVDRAPKTGNLSGASVGGGLKQKQRKVRATDRIFSLTSRSSAVRTEAVPGDAVAKKERPLKKKIAKKRS